MVVMVWQQSECTYCHRIVHFKIVKMVNFPLGTFYHTFFKKAGDNKQKQEKGNRKCPGEENVILDEVSGKLFLMGWTLK